MGVELRGLALCLVCFLYHVARRRVARTIVVRAPRAPGIARSRRSKDAHYTITARPVTQMAETS